MIIANFREGGTVAWARNKLKMVVKTRERVAACPEYLPRYPVRAGSLPWTVTPNHRSMALCTPVVIHIRPQPPTSALTSVTGYVLSM